MTVTLVLPDQLSEILSTVSCEPMESAGVLLASVVHLGKQQIRLLGRAIEWVDDSHYLERAASHLSIASEGYVHALSKAERLSTTPLWIHTHPGISALPSPSAEDRNVDEKISDLFRLRSGSDYYGTLIISPRPHGFTFTGTLQARGEAAIPIERLWMVGCNLRLTRSFDALTTDPLPNFDRNVRAFGSEIQRTLNSLHVGVVGCGGTGSAVAEQLVRLGVRDVTLIDPDVISGSNVTRVYGSTASDLGQAKVDVLAEHLGRIAPDLRCERVRAMLTVESAARRLLPCDAIFGCTDDNAGRLVLSRLATYFLVPVIDCGVLLSSNQAGELIGIDGRVTVLSPGQACLVCRGRIDLNRAGAEMLSVQERQRREDEGYAPALVGVEPAVITFTTSVAAAAVSELLERLIGYGSEQRPSELLLRFHDREISCNVARPRTRHYCDPAVGKLGLGLTDPFLEQAWSA